MDDTKVDTSERRARLAAVLRGMGHPTRLRILERIMRGELCVSELGNALGLRQANVSQHLAILRDRGLVVGERRGNLTCYYLADPRIEGVIALLKEMLGASAEKEVAL